MSAGLGQVRLESAGLGWWDVAPRMNVYICKRYEDMLSTMFHALEVHPKKKSTP